MKKVVLLFAIFATGGLLQAQLGVGTTIPKNTLEIQGAATDVSNSGSSSNGILRIGGSLGTTTLDLGLQSATDAAWLQSRNKGDYSDADAMRLQPNAGNIGIGITGAPAEALQVNGNVKASGFVRGASKGQVLRQILLDASNLNVSSSFVINSTSFTDVISYSYTPVLSSSRLWIRFDARSSIRGSATSGSDDENESVITVNDGNTTRTLQTKKQYYGQFAGAGARESMLFPISGVYDNTGSGSLTIKVQIRRTSGDDGVTIEPDMVLSIVEIVD
jgi:hypothetical protein